MAQPEKMAKLTNLLAYTSWDARWMARRRMLELIGTSALFSLIALFGLSLVIQHLPGGDGWSYLSFGGGVLYVIFAIFLGFRSIRREWSEQQKMLKAALALRAAAEEGNDALAPLAAEQPLPLSPKELAAGPERFAVFGSWKDSSPARAGIGMLCLLAGVGLGILLVVAIINIQPDTGLALAVLLLLVFFLVLASLSLVAAGFIFLLVDSWSKPFHAYAVADERGLLWWRNGWRWRPLLLEWQAAKSFCVIAYAGEQKIKGCQVYVLDGHDRLYLWRVYDGILEDKRAMFEHFNRVVASRGGLPLRDLSAAAAQVTRIAGQVDAV